jgi:hypothetical protein
MLAVGSMTGAFFGANLSGLIPVELWKMLFIVVALYMAINLVHPAKSNLFERLFLLLNKLPWRVIRVKDDTRISIIGLMLIGLLIGVMSAMLGVGGGFLATPYLLIGMRLDIKRAVATSVLMIFLTALAGSISHLSMGHFSLHLFLAAVIGTFAGGITGARLLKKLPEGLIKKIFLAFLVLAILLLIGR